MSHEIRTPMNGVLGMIDVLERRASTSAATHASRPCASSAQALLRIIDDVLDFSKIEAGRLELESTPFSLSGLVDAVVDTFRPQALAKGLTLAAESTPARQDALDRRSDPRAADPVQPVEQRHQIHRAGRRAGARRAPTRSAAGARA